MFCVVGLAGCQAPPRFAVLSDEAPEPASANLVLGRYAETAALAEVVALRSDWPAVERGLRLDDVTFYTNVLYDEQAHYDRFGGLFYSVEAVQTGVWVR